MFYILCAKLQGREIRMRVALWVFDLATLISKNKFSYLVPIPFLKKY